MPISTRVGWAAHLISHAINFTSNKFLKFWTASIVSAYLISRRRFCIHNHSCGSNYRQWVDQPIWLNNNRYRGLTLLPEMPILQTDSEWVSGLILSDQKSNVSRILRCLECILFNHYIVYNINRAVALHTSNINFVLSSLLFCAWPPTSTLIQNFSQLSHHCEELRSSSVVVFYSLQDHQWWLNGVPPDC